jgi:O-antigen/teichoic acid export membrane protein
MLAILLLLPQTFFSFIFGKDFSNLKIVIQSIAAGIFSMALSMILSHYFSGVGKHYHNTISSAIGLIFTLIFGFTLIPSMGIAGAGITASISYSSSMLYQFTVFIKTNKIPLKSLVFTRNDSIFLITEIKNISKTNKN